MIKGGGDISKVKDAVKKCLNKDVRVRVSLGRNKYVTYDGVLTRVYPALFTVSPVGEFNGKTSFSYSELMCGSVRIIKRGGGAK